MADAITTGFKHLQATRYMQLSATALLAYDFILTAPSEITLFWERGFTWAKLLFFMNRYFSVGAITLNSVALLNDRDTDAFCSIWVRYLVTATGCIEIFITQGIISTRIWAMYHNSKFLFYCLVVLFFCTSVSSVVVVHFSLKDVQVTAHAVPGLVACTAIVQPHNIWVFWIPILVFESFAIALALKKSFEHLWYTPLRGSPAQKIIKIMARDSVVYFVLVLVLYIAQACVWHYASPTLLDVMHGMILASLSIMGTRMLINMKEQGRAASDEYISTTELYAMLRQAHSTPSAAHVGETESVW